MLSAESEQKTFLCQSHHAPGTAKARLNAPDCVRRMLSRAKQEWAQVIAHCAVPRLGEKPSAQQLELHSPGSFLA